MSALQWGKTMVSRGTVWCRRCGDWTTGLVDLDAPDAPR